jgi:type I restriction enzyme, R subunit
LRIPTNFGHALDGWYTPKGLTALLKRDEAEAHQQLADEPFDYGFSCAIPASSDPGGRKSHRRGAREMLLAMATGTGKTKTCIALIYRLLKVKRFRRVLFLVDRSALGEQAANAFKDTRMESIQSFCRHLRHQGARRADPRHGNRRAHRHRAGHGQAHALFRARSGSAAGDQYDCIVVDECHRGYLLDRELPIPS